ncbi:MAG: glycosyltransferase family 4 protein [Candidatus Aenigmarchaeota archaeon]|nr:glycosyltransferase family 4 protein [Candidatus Aenigmarchaeota archaeon]
MKILILSDLAPPYIGGGETYVTKLSTGLVNEGHEVHWLTSRIPDTSADEILDGVIIHRAPILFQSKYLFPGRHSFGLTSLIKGIKLARQCDVVQINTLVPGLSGWMIAKYANRPSLLFCHEFFNTMWHKIGQNFFEKYLYPITENLTCKAPYDWFACPSEYSKKTITNYGVPENKVTVIPHGIDTDFFDTANRNLKSFGLEDAPTFGYFGRLMVKTAAHSKNLITLLKAAKLVVESIPNARLLLAGIGYNELEPYVKEMELEKNVVYAGKLPTEDTPSFLKACDVVVCPAISDGFCFLLGEAGASGVATVATNMGAHTERIAHNKTGILTSAEPKNFAENIVKLLNDKSLREEYGRNARDFMTKFTWKKSIDKHVELYNNLIEQKQHK